MRRPCDRWSLPDRVGPAARTALAPPGHRLPTPPPPPARLRRFPPPRRALHLEELAAGSLGFTMPFLTQEETWALTLTTFAGLSTTVGAAFAVSRGFRRRGGGSLLAAGQRPCL